MSTCTESWHGIKTAVQILNDHEYTADEVMKTKFLESLIKKFSSVPPETIKNVFDATSCQIKDSGIYLRDLQSHQADIDVLDQSKFGTKLEILFGSLTVNREVAHKIA